NPLNVQNGTEVERLWKRGNYRPPWLWSLVEVLREGKKLTEARVFSSPSGAGSPRGVHNCGKCDADVINAIKRHSFTQDVREFDGLECSCKRTWKAQLELQDAMRTSVDIDRHLDSELTLD
ncbi:MAG TPA: TIGR01210 family radical SAM protein, partial [Methanomassiliicoccales archaeon]|nr:TIGR01210 family radical SAM protein [Methanomassiliicoccales archaeon]